MPILEYDRHTRPLGPGVLTIGSAPEAGWRVIGHDLAPIHALVTLERDGRAQLARPREDVRILVNGVTMVEPSRFIQAGDAITLGDVTFRMRPSHRQEGATEAAYVRDMSRGRAWRIVDRLDVGRDLGCQVHLPDPDVSRVHAELAMEGTGVVVRPKGGIVFLNGTRVLGEMPLAEGDELGVGRTMLRFTRETPVAAALVPAGEAPRRPSLGDPRMARAQTSYMSVVQAREHLSREQRRRWLRIARIGLGVVAAALLVGAVVTGRASVGVSTPDQSLRR